MIDLDTLTAEEIKYINKQSNIFKFKYGFDGIESFKRALSLVESSRDIKFFVKDDENITKKMLKVIKGEIDNYFKIREKCLKKVKMKNPALNGGVSGSSEL